jgi:hypothetical protein
MCTICRNINKLDISAQVSLGSLRFLELHETCLCNSINRLVVVIEAYCVLFEVGASFLCVMQTANLYNFVSGYT